ncbi:MAG TPA: choice-of-anchor J domain-containing protein, partial [Candidatus Cloacimonadota bacterium]|nr:choice-of-anchor J domain-containing protein [Candidatus Cloacimonadota bacterium]
EWLNLRVNYSSTDTTGPFCTLQAWLHEGTNVIKFVYGQMYNRSTSAQSRAAFISSNNAAGAVGCVATISTTPTWITTSASLTTTSFPAGSYMTNLNSSADGSRRVFIISPPIATDPPNPALLVYPADNGWALPGSSLTWASGGGMPSSFDLYLDTENPPVNLVGDDLTAATFLPTVTPGTVYYWQVVPRNDNGEASDCPVWSFTAPAANQLVESFDDTAFPPVGWANPGTWSRATTTPYYGLGTAYKSAGTTPAILSTPILAIDGSSILDFYYRTSSTTGYGLMNIKYSTDRVTWNQIGATISMPTTTEWNHVTRSLSSITPGNYYLGFEVLTSTSTSSIYIDHVVGPTLASVAPGPVAQTAPLDAATGVSRTPTFTWTAPTVGGVPTGYRIYCDTNADPTTQIGDVTALTFTATTPLNYSTHYYWKVVAYNLSGGSTGNTVRSFDTMADPTIYTMPWLEDFGTTGTTFPPANWTRWSGVLASPSTLISNTSYWVQDNWVNDTVALPVNFSARMNIYTTSRYGWIMSPPIQMPGAGYQLELDIGLTDYGAAAPITADVNGTTGVDDKFIV